MAKKQAKKVVCVRNERGIRVKVGCCSCRFREVKGTGVRYCTITGDWVDRNDYCPKWEMREELMKAGRGTGVVRDIVTKEVILH